MNLRILLPIVLCAASTAVLFAATPVLVKDIAIDPQPGSSSPQLLASDGNIVWFTAFTGITGRELWRSDGTAFGTRLVANLTPGPGWTRFSPVANTRYGTPGGILDGRLFFGAEDAKHGLELWVSDGTFSGTHLFADLTPGAASSTPQRFIRFGELLFFFVDTALRRDVLWVTDGTVDGTHEVVPSTSLGWMGPVFPAADALYFAVGSAPGRYTGTWKTTNGRDARKVGLVGGSIAVAGGTLYVGSWERLERISPSGDPILLAAVANDSPGEPYPLGTTLLFRGRDAAHGLELWRTDGTPQGTAMVKDLNPGPGSSGGVPLGTVNGKALWRTSQNEIWSTDGTTEGTTRLYEFDGPPSTAVYGTEAGGNLYFQYDRGLFVSDGASVRRVEVAGTMPSSLGLPPVMPLGGVAVANLESGSTGSELHRVVDAEATLIADLQTSTISSDPEILAAVGEHSVFFVAMDDDFPRKSIWLTDGTLDGTKRIRTENFLEFICGDFLYYSGSSHLLTRVDAQGREETLPLPPDNFSGRQCAGDLVVFSGSSSGRWRLMLAGGTPWRTQTLTKTFGARPEDFVLIGNRVVFTVSDKAWVTDGTDAGTSELPALDGVVLLANARSRAFVARGKELWVTDGTAGGTRLLRDLSATAWSSIDVAAAVGDDLFFTVGFNGALWKSDGTPDGTVVLSWISNVFRKPQEFRGSERELFFVVDNRVWRTDGTEAGTAAVSDREISFLSALVLVDDRIAFFQEHHSGDDFAVQLIITDGTREGTTVARQGGPADALPRDLTASGSRLFLTFDDATYGRELWTIDLRPRRRTVRH